MIEEINFKDIKEFFDYISPWNKKSNCYKKIYRGHSDESWKLVPSALRSTKIKDLKFENIEKAATRAKMIEREYLSLRDFYKISDQNGLRVPLAPQLRRNISFDFYYFQDEYDNIVGNWIPEDLYESVALAQHYGISTRLLDWSYSPYVALYFAIEGACFDESINSERISIWSMKIDLVDSLFMSKNEKERIKFITPQYELNANLNAQKGLFTYFPCDMETNNIDLCLADQIAISLKYIVDEQYSIFTKFTIPSEEAEKGLKYLEELGFSASTIYPGYAGVAKQINQRSLIRNKLFSK